ncbi:hypothetical protein MHU86_24895 [Fragilaria crotonensis]|nr:hypothetical protein MHU86_24895 [Fragilaria crotonensis]
MSSAHHVLKHFFLTHVHSHQDEGTAFDDLPFPAKLNVLCDTMATEQMQRQATNEDEHTLSIPLRPRNLEVEVTQNGQVLSSHYVARLREIISSATHRQFLQKKYKWSDLVWESISWDAFQICARKPLLSQPVTRSKIVHNWLHLGAQRVKFGAGGTSLEIERCCPYCKQAEDFSHLLTCAEPRARKFRYDAMIPLRKVLSKVGHAGASLLRAITVWTLTPGGLIVITPLDAALGIQVSINRAMASQHHIGWDNFFRGFVSLDWGHIYSLTNATRLTLDANQVQATKTLTTVVMAVQGYSLAIWKSRNAVLHEAGSDSLAIVHAALNHSITQLYSLQHTFSPILQSYFTLPLVNRLSQAPRQRKRWLRLARLATSHASSKGTRQQLLSTYFQYNGSTQPTAPDASCPLPTSTILAVPTILEQLPLTAFFGLSRP